MRIAETRDLDAVRALMREYADSLGIDLSFQGFEEELRQLDTFYDVILIADLEHVPHAGCVALRRIDAETCEMKRLYVRPAARGQRLGKMLAERIIEEARSRGYVRMRLDTLPSMHDAQALYESMGFVEIPGYRHNPVPGTRFLERVL